MFRLEREKFRYFKVKRGQSASEISRELKVPPYAVFCGQIVEVRHYKTYTVSVGETYESVAKKFGASVEELKKTNGESTLYPTKILYIQSGNNSA